MIPEATYMLVHLGGVEDPADIRETLLVGLDAMNHTLKRRELQWREAEEPPTVEEIRNDPHLSMTTNGPIGESKAIGRHTLWRQRQTAAKNGDVLNQIEMDLVRRLVRSYSLYPISSELAESTSSLQELRDRYPDTQIARAAEARAELAESISR